MLNRLEIVYQGALSDRNWTAANQAVIAMGKFLKMFVDRVEHVRTIEDATTQELVAKLQQIGEKLGIEITHSARWPATDEGSLN